MAFTLLSRVMFYVMASKHDPGADKCLAPGERHREGWDSGIPALSASPNDGIHLLFYGHSWSSVAPIRPKAHNLFFFFLHLSSPDSLPSSSLFYCLLSSFFCTFILLVHQPALSALFFPILIYLPIQHPSFTFPSLLLGSLP